MGPKSRLEKINARSKEAKYDFCLHMDIKCQDSEEFSWLDCNINCPFIDSETFNEIIKKLTYGTK